VSRQNGFAIRAFRQAAQIPVSRMAEFADVHPGHYRKIEAETRNAQPEQLARIAKALDVPVAAIVRAAPAEPVSAGRETVRA
jgi:transcriptional regulator with XRE-family HTH domain